MNRPYPKKINISQRGKKVISVTFCDGYVEVETWHVGPIKTVVLYDDKSKTIIDAERNN